MMDGLLVIDKPAGKSSHDVVNAVRRITGEKRVGHAGTLDPMATGVLVICLGYAVRLSEYLIDHDKRYRATIRLGIETDTYDATGQVTGTRAVDVTREQVRTALELFVGTSQQIPPAHSAVQRDGVRAYKLARRGVAVAMEPRVVQIYSLTLLDMEEDRVAIEVHCGKGTYIRSLAHDLGARLGTGAHLAALRRLASGPFALEASVPFEQLTELATTGGLDKFVLPADRAVMHLSAIRLDAPSARAVHNGQFLPDPGNLTTPLVRAYDQEGRFIALLERARSGSLKPKKVI